jgi:hypothetical protein
MTAGDHCDACCLSPPNRLPYLHQTQDGDDNEKPDGLKQEAFFLPRSQANAVFLDLLSHVGKTDPALVRRCIRATQQRIAWGQES